MQIVQTNILFLPTAGLIVIIPSSLRLLLCSGSNMLLLQVWTALVRDNPSCRFPPFPAAQIVSRKFSPLLHLIREPRLHPSAVLRYSPFFLSCPQSIYRRVYFLPPCSTHLHSCIYVIASPLSPVFILNNLSSFSLPS